MLPKNAHAVVLQCRPQTQTERVKAGRGLEVRVLLVVSS